MTNLSYKIPIQCVNWSVFVVCFNGIIKKKSHKSIDIWLKKKNPQKSNRIKMIKKTVWVYCAALCVYVQEIRGTEEMDD